MLKRKIEKDINEWISDDNRALLVYGVRQAGKTYIIRKCLNDREIDYVEFNLIREPEVKEILENSHDINDLIMKLSLYSDKKLTPKKTIIFFDEIQRYKDIVTKIKFLVEDGRFRYILSGSLLGVELYNLRSAPVGYLRSLKLYPLDLEEFLQVFNISDEVVELLKRSFDEHLYVDEIIHNRMMRIFDLYLIIGGMPAAIERYRETYDIDRVIDEHKNIIEQYKLDFTQYENEDRKLMISDVYDLIPAELNSENKRFMITDIKKDLRYNRVDDSFIWLYKAGVALPTFNVTEPKIPLLINKKRSLLKLFLSDVGLLTTIYGKATKLKILNNDKDINKGSIYENIIAQEIYAHNLDPYYYQNKKYGEIDFVIEYDGRILPIEVKSGKDYKRHSALNNLLYKVDYGIEEAIVFTKDNVKVDDKIVYLPIYMIMFIKDKDISFDISPSF